MPPSHPLAAGWGVPGLALHVKGQPGLCDGSSGGFPKGVHRRKGKWHHVACHPLCANTHGAHPTILTAPVLHSSYPSLGVLLLASFLKTKTSQFFAVFCFPFSSKECNKRQGLPERCFPNEKVESVNMRFGPPSCSRAKNTSVGLVSYAWRELLVASYEGAVRVHWN